MAFTTGPQLNVGQRKDSTAALRAAFTGIQNRIHNEKMIEAKLEQQAIDNAFRKEQAASDSAYKTAQAQATADFRAGQTTRADALAGRQQSEFDRVNRERAAKSKIEDLVLHGEIAPISATIPGERRLPTTKEGRTALGEERKGVYEQGISEADYTNFNTPENIKLATDYSTAYTTEQDALRNKPQTEVEVNADEQKALAELDVLKKAGTITTEDYNIGKRSVKAVKKTNLDAIDASTDEVPRYYDWRTKSYVGPTGQNVKDIDLVNRRIAATEATTARQKAEFAYKTALHPTQRKNVDTAIKAGNKALTNFDKKFIEKKLTTPEYRAKVLEYGSGKAKELKLNKEETSSFMEYLKNQIAGEVANKDALKIRLAKREDFKFEEGVKSGYDKELEAAKTLNKMAEADSKYARQKEKGGVTEAHAQAFKKYQMAFKTLSDDDSTSSAKKEAKRILRWYDKNYPNG